MGLIDTPATSALLRTTGGWTGVHYHQPAARAALAVLFVPPFRPFAAVVLVLVSLRLGLEGAVFSNRTASATTAASPPPSLSSSANFVWFDD